MINVYSLGSNGNYQLGLGHADDMIVPQLSFKLERPPGRDTRVKKVVCGGNHTVILLDDGDAYVCGDNRVGQLLDRDTQNGLELVKTWVKWPVRCAKPVDVACGWDFTVIVDSNSEIWSRGDGPKGELGLGVGVTRSESFQRVESIDTSAGLRAPPKVFSSFQNCTVVLQLAGEIKSRVYGWGNNNYCQLFEPRCKVVAEPTLIYESRDTVIDYVAMGKNFIVFVSTEGKIVDIKGKVPEGFKLEDWNGTKGTPLQIYAMWSSLHIKTFDSKIFSYGFRMFGQLFDNDAFHEQFGKNSSSNYQILSMNTGSEHGIMVTTTTSDPETQSVRYHILCWGWGEHGNCGRLHHCLDLTRADRTPPEVAETPTVNDYTNVVSPLNELISVVKKSDDQRSTAPMVFGGCANTWIVTYT